MVEPYLRRSALAHKSLVARASESRADAGVKLGESAFRCQINLRGNPDEPAFAAEQRPIISCNWTENEIAILGPKAAVV